MSETVTAVYEDGVLRPLAPLKLPNRARVRLQIEHSEAADDPVFDLIGAFSSDRPLIDNIPVSEDPGLYLLAEAWGEAAQQMHAWEIAPQRYRQGKDGQPVRCDNAAPTP